MGHGISGISWNFKRSIPDIESQGIIYIYFFFSKSWNIRDFCSAAPFSRLLARSVLCKQHGQTAATLTRASSKLSFSQRLSCA